MRSRSDSGGEGPRGNEKCVRQLGGAQGGGAVAELGLQRWVSIDGRSWVVGDGSVIRVGHGRS